MSVTEPGGTTSDPVAETDTGQEKPALSVTRRNFLIGAGAGAAAAGVVLGGAVVANKALNPETTTTTTTTAGGPVPATMRRVSLDIDNVKYDLIVDNRESLWETMTHKLGMSSSNLGCDRAQCGACAVLVDGKAVNGCTVLTARLGRGQKITTVAGLPRAGRRRPAPDPARLLGRRRLPVRHLHARIHHVDLPAARREPEPNTAQIAEGLCGNICRCGEYAKIFTSVNVAAAEMRGEQVSHLATPVLVGVAGTKEAAPSAAAHPSSSSSSAVPDDRGVRAVRGVTEGARRHPRGQRQRAYGHGQVGHDQARRGRGPSDPPRAQLPGPVGGEKKWHKLMLTASHGCRLRGGAQRRPTGTSSRSIRLAGAGRRAVRDGRGRPRRVRPQAARRHGRDDSCDREPRELPVQGHRQEIARAPGLRDRHRRRPVHRAPTHAGHAVHADAAQPHPHAKIKSIDTTEAEKLPGVRKILHRGNLPDEYKDVKLGSALPTASSSTKRCSRSARRSPWWPPRASTSPTRRCALIKVQYEVLPAALDMIEAMKSSTAKQWQNNLDGTIIDVTPPLVRGEPDTPAPTSIVDERVDQGHRAAPGARADQLAVLLGQRRAPRDYTNQYAHGSRSGLSQALKIPQNKVRVIQPGYMGSGYGYRSGIDLSEVHAAILAKMTGRPVKNMYTRVRGLRHPHAPPAVPQRDEDRRQPRRHAPVRPVQGHRERRRAARRRGQRRLVHHAGPVQHPEPASSRRSTSSPTATSQARTAASATRTARSPSRLIDGEGGVRDRHGPGRVPPEEPERRAAIPTPSGRSATPGMRECLDQAARRASTGARSGTRPKAKEVRPGVFHGIGLAAHACSHGGGGNPSTGQVIVNTDGSVQAVSGVNEIGSGQRTKMAMIAAESIGVPLSAVTITPYIDTDLTTDTGGTSGSRRRTPAAAACTKRPWTHATRLLDWAARKFVDDARQANPPQTITVTADDLEIVDGSAVLKADRTKKLPLAEVVQFGGDADRRPVRLRAADHAGSARPGRRARPRSKSTPSPVRSRSRDYVAAHDVGQGVQPVRARAADRGRRGHGARRGASPKSS